MKNKTQRRIIGESISATYALSVIDNLWDVLEAFKGKKIVKVDNTLTKAFKDAITPYLPPRGTSLDTNGYNVTAKPHRVNIHASYSSLVWEYGNATTFRKAIGGDDFNYYDLTLYIGKIEEQKLIIGDSKADLIELLTKQQKLQFEDVAKVQAEIEKLKTEIWELRGTIPHFA